MSKKYQSIAKIVVVLAGIYLASRVISIFLPIILALILAFILNPVVNFFVKIPIGPAKYHMPKSLAIFFAFMSTAIILFVVIAYVFLPLSNEFEKFIRNLPSILLKLQNITSLINERAVDVDLPQNIRTLIDQALSSAAAFSVNMLRRLVNSILSFASQVVELVVVPVLTYYFLKDGLLLKEATISLFPASYKVKTKIIFDEMSEVVSAYIRGQVIISVVMGLLVFIGMYFLKVDYPLVLGLIATLTEAIPIVGPIIGAVPGILLAYLYSPVLAAKVTVYYLIAHQLENHIIVPKIMGHTISLHPIFVIISLLIGGQLYGIVGMILAVPIAAILRILLKHLWADRNA